MNIHTLIERGVILYSDEPTGRVYVLEGMQKITAWDWSPSLQDYFFVGKEPLSFDMSEYDGPDALEMATQEAEDMHINGIHQTDKEAA